PEERVKHYTTALQLSEYDARVISEEKAFSDYFENVISNLPTPRIGEGSGMRKAAANWMLGPIKSWLNENKKEIIDFPVSTNQIASLIELIDNGKVSFSAASTKIFSVLLQNTDSEPEKIANMLNLIQQSDVSSIGHVIDLVLEKFADKVIEYKKGKKGLLSLFVGEVMKQSKGKADPKLTNQLLLEKLK
ncbi:MAG: Asp-tRNA(Asn)/Glu-tRNA(Gln) amidotransferase GatCAB subunit B, partial [Chitinophagaceae bacterium]